MRSLLWVMWEFCGEPMGGRLVRCCGRFWEVEVNHLGKRVVMVQTDRIQWWWGPRGWVEVP